MLERLFHRQDGHLVPEQRDFTVPLVHAVAEAISQRDLRPILVRLFPADRIEIDDAKATIDLLWCVAEINDGVRPAELVSMHW